MMHGCVVLSAFLELDGRQIGGWAMTEHMRTELALALEALLMAVVRSRRIDPSSVGVVNTLPNQIDRG